MRIFRKIVFIDSSRKIQLERFSVLGKVLMKDDSHDGNVISADIIKYSMERQQNVNINDSLALLASIDRSITMSDYSRLEESTDHVIWYA